VNRSITHRKGQFMSKPRYVSVRREKSRKRTYLRSGRHAVYRREEPNLGAYTELERSSHGRLATARRNKKPRITEASVHEVGSAHSN
jgi:hypothetical protein